MSKIVIEALYGEYNNLYGDRGNLLYLTEQLRAAGCPFEVVRTHLYDKPAFAGGRVDFLYIGPCTERQQELQLEALRPYREALAERLEDGTVTLATGNAFELFGRAVENEDGSSVEALGFWDTTARRFTRLRYNDLSMGRFGQRRIVGFKNQLSHSYGRIDTPFLEMELGSGLNPDVRQEGFASGGFFATYLLGPLLALNPDFAADLLKRLAPEAEFPVPPIARKAYESRLEEYVRLDGKQPESH
jgi:CobQ-like glutamine amidotransferase family enzyme